MNLRLVGILCLGISACGLTPQSSNTNDGGVCPAPTVASGSGTVSSPVSFTAGAAYESVSSTHDPDGGLLASYLFLSLSERAALCGEVPADGGVAPGGKTLGAILLNNAGAITPGDYLVQSSDGGRAAIVYGGDGSRSYVATSGSVTLDTVTNCSATGRLTLSVSTDGGSTPITGSFDSRYCGGR